MGLFTTITARITSIRRWIITGEAARILKAYPQGHTVTVERTKPFHWSVTISNPRGRVVDTYEFLV